MNGCQFAIPAAAQAKSNCAPNENHQAKPCERLLKADRRHRSPIALLDENSNSPGGVECNLLASDGCLPQLRCAPRKRWLNPFYAVAQNLLNGESRLLQFRNDRSPSVGNGTRFLFHSQSRFEFIHRLETPLRFFLQALQDDGFNVGRECLHDFARALRQFAKLHHSRRNRIVARERRGACNHLVEQEADGIDIGARVHMLKPDLLRGHVGGRAGDSAGHLRIAANHARDSEVHDLHAAAPVHNDVRGFQIPVNDCLQVRFAKARANLAADLKCFIHWNRSEAPQSRR